MSTAARLRLWATDHRTWRRMELDRWLRPIYGGRGTILSYHRICPARKDAPGYNRWLEATPELLDETIRFLRRSRFAFISLDEAVEAIVRDRASGRFVVFTLDDGYADNLTHAAPVFRAHGVPYTVYITTSFPDRTATLWWYALEDYVQTKSFPGGASHGVDLDGPAATTLHDLFDRRASTLSSSGDPAVDLERLTGISALDARRYVERLALNWDQVAQLAADPLATIGAHTVNHLPLAMLEEETARREIVDSRTRLEAFLQRPVRHFCYPYGGRRAVGARETRLVAQSGFATAVTTFTGNVFKEHRRHLHSLPRIPGTLVAGEPSVEYLRLYVNGVVACHENHFRRVVTV
jgi:peptidoglycan/xylan/chitin deacetylase (PgdA/CDA1 family)